MTIYTPNGTEVSEIVLPDGSTASEVVAPDGTTVFSSIPDSVVSRPADDGSASDTLEYGVRIESDETWDSIDVEISANTSTITNISVYRVSDGTEIGSDTGSYGSGDVATVSLSPSIQPADGTKATKYNVVGNAGGSTYTAGFYGGGQDLPYESAEGQLRIIDTAKKSTDTSGAFVNIVKVGNIL